MQGTRNVAAAERWASIALGAALTAFAVRKRGRAGFAAVSVGAELLYRGFTGYCPLYGALGLTTYVRPEEYASAAVGHRPCLRLEQTVFVARTAPELYRFWRKLETLPAFMTHLEEVTVLTERRSRWRVRAPVGSRVTWEAEIVSDVPGESISWRSLPGSAIHHAGSVHFDQRDGLTQVRVVLEFGVLARSAPAEMARILGQEPERQVAGDLQRFKAIAERDRNKEINVG
ncbi:MAG TPA: SRPBCC family protein [Candidatus Baltobacteraceae bacterium]|jgi:uncharacterized membrane protein